MTLKSLVTMNSQGSITVPAQARELLKVGPDSHFELEVTEHEMVLRPALAIRREDAWAYTPDHLASVQRALQQVKGKRTHPLFAADLVGGNEESASSRRERRPANGKKAIPARNRHYDR